MDTKTIYEMIGGDYEEALGRLRKPERVEKFLKLFLKDTTFSELKASMEAGDLETAFRAAHTAKGVCANLSLERLRAKASDLTEDLRDGHDPEHAKLAYPDVEACYEETVRIIRENLDM